MPQFTFDEVKMLYEEIYTGRFLARCRIMKEGLERKYGFTDYFWYFVYLNKHVIIILPFQTLMREHGVDCCTSDDIYVMVHHISARTPEPIVFNSISGDLKLRNRCTDLYQRLLCDHASDEFDFYEHVGVTLEAANVVDVGRLGEFHG